MKTFSQRFIKKSTADKIDEIQQKYADSIVLKTVYSEDWKDFLIPIKLRDSSILIVRENWEEKLKPIWEWVKLWRATTDVHLWNWWKNYTISTNEPGWEERIFINGEERHYDNIKYIRKIMYWKDGISLAFDYWINTMDDNWKSYVKRMLYINWTDITIPRKYGNRNLCDVDSEWLFLVASNWMKCKIVVSNKWHIAAFKLNSIKASELWKKSTILKEFSFKKYWAENEWIDKCKIISETELEIWWKKFLKKILFPNVLL